MYILTSNLHKISEYRKFGIEAIHGPDIREVLGTIDEVITYKIMSAPPNTLVEDTVLEIGGQEVVDTKYKLKEIRIQENVAWVTSLGYHDTTRLFVYRGTTKGKIVVPVIEHPTSFEPCFVPAGATITLYELKQLGMKDQFSARRLAILAYRQQKPHFIKEINSIPRWEGRYQNEL
ncbi:MAG: hypothetical protein DI538_06170 [Azospira oryzae]|nr:MAG: hypothetical protein DI538_06170 [Azospira oryzae]